MLVKQSKIKGAGQGLFTKKYISKGQPVVTYYGEKIKTEEVLKMFLQSPKQYYELNKQIRGTPHGYSVKGQIDSSNLSLCGVLVNDISSINCKKQDLTKEILQLYVKTSLNCNLITDNSFEYPVYVSSRRIKKDEELYVHYGIGYWLSHIGCTPDEISDLNKKWPFHQL